MVSCEEKWRAVISQPLCYCVLLKTGVKSDPEQKGVIPNSFDHIFSHIARTENQQYLVRASYLEIYMVCWVSELLLSAVLCLCLSLSLSLLLCMFYMFTWRNCIGS